MSSTIFSKTGRLENGFDFDQLAPTDLVPNFLVHGLQELKGILVAECVIQSREFGGVSLLEDSLTLLTLGSVSLGGPAEPSCSGAGADG
jgi:hypothetical protein